MKCSVLAFFLLLFCLGRASAQDTLEHHISDIHGGLHAEVCFSADRSKLIYHATKDEYVYDRIFVMNSDGSNKYLVITHTGRTTCGYYFPDGTHILYASTHFANTDYLPNTAHTYAYVWAVFRDYDIFSVNPDVTWLKQLPTTKSYDTEGTISPDGKTIVFTSACDGDIKIYTMNADGSIQKRLTFDQCYDDGTFSSTGGENIEYRTDHPVTPDDENNGINTDGYNLEQLTTSDSFDGFPMFSPYGKKFVFAPAEIRRNGSK
jgi:TolB protein